MNKNKKIVVLIIDGWGKGEENISNPFRYVQTPTIDNLKKEYPFCFLSASGYSIGLLHGEAPTCEISHLTIGTGIIYYQPLVRINLSIENGQFFKNQNLIKILNHLKKFNSRLHLITLLTQNQYLASINHLETLLLFFNKEQNNKIFLHLFTDGIDSPQKSAFELIKKIIDFIQENRINSTIATLCGRFYALDKTNNYILRTLRAFKLINDGNGKYVENLNEFFKFKYSDPQFNDNLLEPIILDQEGSLKDNDAILFLNLENKSIYQLARCFLDKDFKEFETNIKKNIFVSSLIRYIENLNYPVLFDQQKITTNLSRIIAENNLKQLKIITESKKELFKFYFNGFFEEDHPGEVFKIIPDYGQDIQNLIEQTEEILSNLKLAIKDKVFDIIFCHLPIFEIIAQKGNFKLAIEAIKFLDKTLESLVKNILEENYALIITSDHGNIEKIVDPKSGSKDTLHNPNPVPFFIIDKEYFKQKSKEEMSFFEKKIIGNLVDVPSTILSLLNIKIPQEFMGKDLLPYLR
jgi:2,3-bisphosphoglycerate-independent phosphoglycerate mutase